VENLNIGGNGIFMGNRHSLQSAQCTSQPANGTFAAPLMPPSAHLYGTKKGWRNPPEKMNFL
jgi:hypothetical protein